MIAFTISAIEHTQKAKAAVIDNSVPYDEPESVEDSESDGATDDQDDSDGAPF